MVRQNDEMPFGWPLGLSFLSIRLRVAESLPAAPAEPYSLHAPSSSFSSFSSSNLDTEGSKFKNNEHPGRGSTEVHLQLKRTSAATSSASFFQDNSVSLGRLIGIRGGERGRLYFPHSLRLEERDKKKKKKTSLERNRCEEEGDRSGANNSICIPILLDAFLKSSRTKKTSRN